MDLTNAKTAQIQELTSLLQAVLAFVINMISIAHKTYTSIMYHFTFLDSAGNPES